MFNLSLFTSDKWALVIHIFFYHQKVCFHTYFFFIEANKLFGHNLTILSLILMQMCIQFVYMNIFLIGNFQFLKIKNMKCIQTGTTLDNYIVQNRVFKNQIVHTCCQLDFFYNRNEKHQLSSLQERKDFRNIKSIIPEY